MADLRIGIDTGGTFTDVAVIDRGRLEICKVSSTPDDPARAVLQGIAAVRRGRPVDVVHGTTVGLNAVLTNRLARTAFVTNEGFVDLVEIGRQDRSGLYELEPTRPEFPVPRALRFPIAQRRLADGTLAIRPTASALRDLAARLRRARVESIAIGLLHSHTHPEDEDHVASALAGLGVPITCSARLLPRAGEFERFAAAVLNAAIRPLLGDYLGRLGPEVEPGGLRLMRSSGGIMAHDEAREFPARAMFSGPAGGVIATARIAAMRSVERVAALDMGGTSTDVALVGPEPQADDDERSIAGLPLPLPGFDVHTVGCGGGSVAWVDAGGALRVGPRSAGADPGPACYGRSDEPTVTDAHVALGHIQADTLLGGGMPIDPDRAVQAIERLARRLGLDPSATARGVLAVADVAMARALLVITSERAVDPATVPLVAYGGAGGLHAAALAARLSMPYALIPPAPGAFSAIGLGLAGASCERLEPVHARCDARMARAVHARGRQLALEAATALGGGRSARTRTDVRVRYTGQGAGIWLPSGARLEERFRSLHRTRYGFELPDTSLEVLELRAEARRPGPRLGSWATAQPTIRSGEPVTYPAPPLRGPRTPVWDRDQLAPGTILPGPALIRELTAVVRVPGDWIATVTLSGLALSPAQ